MTLLPLVLSIPVAFVPPRMDGEFVEWTGANLVASDPSGDASGPLDVLALHAASAGTDLFVSFDLANSVNLSSGPTSSTTLRLVITSGGRSVTIDFRGRKAYLDGNTNNVVTWPSIDYVAQPTVASNRHELRIDLSIISVTQGGTVTLNFTGADSLPAPVQFMMTAPPLPVPRADPSPRACTDLRVASLNTLFSGLIDGARQPAIARLLDAVNADVYCFQEEYDSTAAQIVSFLNGANPLENGLPWNVVKSSDLAIASQSPLLAVPMGQAHQGALVLRGGGRDVLVVTNHPKCCGYTGSSEDSQRISQAQSAIAALASFRAGTAGAALAPYKDVPVVLVGDWNLVGSVTPLNLWLAQPSPAMTRLPIPHLIGDDITTWASPSGLDFWPGVLDVLVYDRAKLYSRNAYSLDSAVLNSTERAMLGLQASDSAASDHLLLVADFGYLPSADFNADGFSDAIDYDTFILTWLANNSQADLNSDGFTDAIDFDLFISAWLGGC